MDSSMNKIAPIPQDSSSRVSELTAVPLYDDMPSVSFPLDAILEHSSALQHAS